MRKIRPMLKLVLFIFTITILFQTSAVSAYNAGGAASYAETWAKSYNQDNFPVFDSDCTNFVSQCMNWGGKVAELYGSNEESKWYCDKTWLGTFSYSTSWVNTSFFYNFMRSRSNNVGTWTKPFPNGVSAIKTGDLLLFDFDGGGSKDHAAIITSYGKCTETGVTGNLLCQHSNGRYRTIWHAKPFNKNWATTKITVVRPTI